MRVRFSKMHGLGNDFVVIDAVRQSVAIDAAAARQLADRRYGIGCDQILLAEPPTRPDTDFRYRIFNADGGEVEHCGNGVRCLGRFLVEHGLTDRRELRVETVNGQALIRLGDDGRVTVNMGAPILEPAAIPFRASQREVVYSVEVSGESVTLSAVSMGNPHAVLLVDDVRNAPMASLGPALETHPAFPNRVNVGFLEVLAADVARLRVYERGVGETLACGTGACAAVVAGRLRGLLEGRVRVELSGGALDIAWPGEGTAVEMTGPAVTVFDGEIDLAEAGVRTGA